MHGRWRPWWPPRDICGWTWRTSGRKRNVFFSMRRFRLRSCSAHPLRRWSRNLGKRRRAQQHLNRVYRAGLGLSLNAKGDLAHPGLRTRGRARWLASLTVVLLGHREDVSGWIGGGKRSRADAVSHLQLLAPPPPHTCLTADTVVGPMMRNESDGLIPGYTDGKLSGSSVARLPLIKRVIRPKPPLSRAPLRLHYEYVGSIVSLASCL